MNRIGLIQKSLNIFVYGWLSLIPILGLGPALFAIFGAIRIHHRYRAEWNPAQFYLNWGLTLALLSLGISAIALPIIGFHLMPPFASD